MALYYFYKADPQRPASDRRVGPLNLVQMRSRISRNTVDRNTLILRVKPNSSELRPAEQFQELGREFPEKVQRRPAAAFPEEWTAKPAESPAVWRSKPRRQESQANALSAVGVIELVNKAAAKHFAPQNLQSAPPWRAEFGIARAAAAVTVQEPREEKVPEQTPDPSPAIAPKTPLTPEQREEILRTSRQYASRARREEYQRRRNQAFQLIGGVGLFSFFLIAIFAAIYVAYASG